MQFEEVDSVQEPADIDILLPNPYEHRLLLMIGVRLSLRHIEVRYSAVAVVGVEG